MPHLAPAHTRSRNAGFQPAVPVSNLPSSLAPVALSAWVTGLDVRRRVLIALGEAAAPQPARLLRGISRSELFDANGIGREVLVVLDAARKHQPVVVGLLESEDEPETSAAHTPAAPKEAVLLEALAELVLKCGASSITLRRDGKIVLRGTHLLSRSSGPIRIKGGHVEIN